MGAMHARGSGEAARRAKRERQPEKKKEPLPSRAISHARGHLRVSRFARQTTEKRETARSLTFCILRACLHGGGGEGGGGGVTRLSI